MGIAAPESSSDPDRALRLCTSQSTTGALTTTPILIPKPEGATETRGFSSLGKQAAASQSICDVFLAGSVYPGTRRGAEGLCCFPANTGSTCPAQSWARPGEPGNCTGSARPGRGQEKTWHLPGPAQGHCCRELVLLMGQRSESGLGFLAVE